MTVSADLRIAVTGSGAMGTLFGARLALAGYKTALIDVDPQRLATIQAQGLTLHDDRGEHHTVVDAGRAGDFTEPVDLLIVFTKSMHTAAAVRDACHLLRPTSAVLTLQNGLGNESLIADIVGRERIAFGTTNWPADLLGSGHVRSHGVGMVRLWSLGGLAAPALQQIADILNNAKLECRLDAQVQVAIWEKVIFNAAMNGITALTRNTVGGLADSADAHALIAHIVEEGVAVSRALRVTVDAVSISSAIRHALEHHRTHKTSMLQDVEARRQTEVDAILGAIGRAGRSVHVPTPVIDTLTALINIIDFSR